jgi:hypothetical protein
MTTTRIVTDSNWGKHITTEPLLHPPKRTWVGLTAAQCGVLWKVDMTPFEYYQAIEAKLKELNG